MKLVFCVGAFFSFFFLIVFTWTANGGGCGEISLSKLIAIMTTLLLWQCFRWKFIFLVYVCSRLFLLYSIDHRRWPICSAKVSDSITSCVRPWTVRITENKIIWLNARNFRTEYTSISAYGMGPRNCWSWNRKFSILDYWLTLLHHLSALL